MKIIFEGIVEGEETIPVVSELNSWDVVLNGAIGSRGIVDHGGFKIVILYEISSILEQCNDTYKGIILIEHSICDVGDVVSSI